VKLQQVVARQGQSREQPSIELGRKGILPVADARGVTNAEWTVLGYVERSTGAPMSDDWFGWQEYLLYNVQHGYRWLVFDEGNFLLITPLAAGDIDASRVPVFVRRNNIHYRQRNSQQARVDFVLGEFYWKVEVGERVEAADYQAGGALVSREESETEVSWTYSVLCSRDAVAAAFGIATPSGGGAAWTPSSPGQAKLIGYLLIIGFFFLIFASGHCGGGSGGGGGGGWGGGGGGSGGGGGASGSW
jgi:uncharacterized membrane protein YgcG